MDFKFCQIFVADFSNISNGRKIFFFFVFATLSGVETLKYPPFFLLKDAFKTKTLGLVA